ncbi:MAG: glycoside hydrolase family 3 N-terminal domain-containing protein [Gemmatimonadaceae bacterium]
MGDHVVSWSDASLDSSGVPGTLSSKVLTVLLRSEMQFKGIIISDAMDMRGVLDQYGAVEAVKRALAAGVDVLIQPLSVSQTIDAVVAGVQEGRYTEARLDGSVRRILRAKATLGLDKAKLVDLNALRSIVGDSSHLNTSNRIATKSITLVKDSLGYVPLEFPPNAKILSVGVSRRTDL